MPKVENKELISRLADLVKDDTRPEALSILEDVRDTLEDSTDISSYETRIQELEAKVVSTEKEWRDRYIERFKDYSSSDVTPSTATEQVESEVDNGANDDNVEPPSFEDIAKEF